MHSRLFSRKDDRIVAGRMRLLADQAVPDWLCEFATLIDAELRSPEAAAKHEFEDAKRAKAGDISGFAELYPHRETQWSCFLTLRYLSKRAVTKNRVLTIQDILDAAPAVRGGVEGYERLIARKTPGETEEIVRDAVACWLDNAEDAVRRAAGIADRRLARSYAIEQKYRASQSHLRKTRQKRETASPEIPMDVLDAAADPDIEQVEDVDRDHALAIVRRSAIAGDARARHALGLAYLAAHDDRYNDAAEGVMWLERAAADGHAPASYELARVYAEGEHTARDPVLALAWCKMAAASRHKRAMRFCRRLEHDLPNWERTSADWLYAYLATGAARRIYPDTAATKPSHETSA